MIDAPGIGPRGDHARGEERLDLGAPKQPAVDLGVVERADPDAVAAEDQRARLAVPERDGELPPRLVEHPFAQVLVEVDPGLGVATGREPMAARQELPT